MIKTRWKGRVPAVLRELNAAQNRTLRKAGSHLEGAVKKMITSGGPGDWPPLEEATVKRKKSSKPLIDTGKLRSSITHELDGNTVRVGIFGEEATIGAVHEFGSPRKGIPPRSFLRSTFEEETDELVRIIKNDVKDTVKTK